MRRPGIAAGAVGLFFVLQSLDFTAAAGWLVLVGGAALANGWDGLDLDRPLSPVERAALVFVLVLAAAALLGMAPRHSFLLGLPTLAALLVGSLISRGSVREDDGAWLAMAMVAAAGIQLGALAVHARLGGDPAAWAARAPSSWLIVPNDIAWLGCCLPLLGALYRPRPLVTSLAAFVLFAAVCVWLKSRTGLLVGATSVGAFSWLHAGWLRPGRRVAPALVVGLLATLTGLVAALPSMQARAQLWLAALRLFLAHPFAGVGPHNFGLAYRATTAQTWVDPRVTPWPHNLFLEVGAEMGFCGLLALAGVGWAIRARTAAIMARTPHRLHCAALAGLAGLLAAALVEASLLRLWTWCVAGLLLGLLAREQAAPGTPTTIL